ncbi:MAG: hypothetical protein KC910_11790 [Candidatus Eremiobacteraeota bacterium]|nr:hypothetical protein [Candidatus Eremiobacteraeota bacterium]
MTHPERDNTNISPRDTIEFLKSFSDWLKKPEGRLAVAQHSPEHADEVQLGKQLMRHFREHGFR